MIEIQAYNVPQLYAEGMSVFHMYAMEAPSRNGPVYTIPDPVELVIQNPKQRVLFDPVRDANPFFHVMEAIWMFSGGYYAKFLLEFNKGYAKYVEPSGEVHGAYGARWLWHFGKEQIREVIKILREDPHSRQAVIQMWDASRDLSKPIGIPDYKDRPCNTQICFRTRPQSGRLDMTVFNRSNDFVWGAAGANAVHMTMLHEIVATCTGQPVGTYRVVTNNLHLYKDLPVVKKEYGKLVVPVDPYHDIMGLHFPLLSEHEGGWEEFSRDCARFVNGVQVNNRTGWLARVAEPMLAVWRLREQDYALAINSTHNIAAPDWRMACVQWLTRRQVSKVALGAAGA